MTAQKGKVHWETFDMGLVDEYANLLGCRNACLVGEWSFSASLAKISFRQSTSASASDAVISPSGSTITKAGIPACTAANATQHQSSGIEV